MVQVLVTDDSNEGQRMSVPVPGRSSPLTAQAVPASSIISPAPLWGSATFVDPQTSLAPADQTGAPSTPFSTVQLAADIGGDGDTIVLGPGDADTCDLIQKAFTFFGLGLVPQSFSAFDRPRIGNVTYTDPALGNKVQRFVNINVTGTVDLSSEGYLAAQGSLFEDEISGVLLSEFDGSVVLAPLTAVQVESFNSRFEDEITADFANFRNSTTGGPVNAAVSCSFFNHTWSGITVTSPSITLDRFSLKAAVAAGVVFSTVPVVVDPAPFVLTQFGATTISSTSARFLVPGIGGLSAASAALSQSQIACGVACTVTLLTLRLCDGAATGDVTVDLVINGATITSGVLTAGQLTLTLVLGTVVAATDLIAIRVTTTVIDAGSPDYRASIQAVT